MGKSGDINAYGKEGRTAISVDTVFTYLKTIKYLILFLFFVRFTFR